MGIIAGFFAIYGLLMVGLAIPLISGKVHPNSWYGLRIQTTLENPGIWYPANSYTGWLLLVYGVITIGLTFLLLLLPGISDSLYAISLSIYMVLGILIVGILGIRYAKRLEKELLKEIE